MLRTLMFAMYENVHRKHHVRINHRYPAADRRCAAVAVVGALVR
jgi:hypothetical protein